VLQLPVERAARLALAGRLGAWRCRGGGLVAGPERATVRRGAAVRRDAGEESRRRDRAGCGRAAERAAALPLETAQTGEVERTEEAGGTGRGRARCGAGAWSPGEEVRVCGGWSLERSCGGWRLKLGFGLGAGHDDGPLVGCECRPGLQPRQPRVEIRPCCGDVNRP
jgi:hypothetical protein